MFALFMFIIGSMFGGLIGVFTICLILANKRKR